MAHISENSQRLIIKYITIHSRDALYKTTLGLTDVCLLRLPACDKSAEYIKPLKDIGSLTASIVDNLGPEATLIAIGEVIDLVQIQTNMPLSMRYQHWIAIKSSHQKIVDDCTLPISHFGALIHTKYRSSLHHTKTRIEYSYCPACDKTTKDYGGKKHTYHKYGTLISDVWRDLEVTLEGNIEPIVDRFADLFGNKPYKELFVLDCRYMNLKRSCLEGSLTPVVKKEKKLPHNLVNKILQGDCLEQLRTIPTNSVDFAFADPPYNLRKKYSGYSDDLKITEYFNWCDRWISELARILRPGRTLAILNIPLWAIRHFIFLQSILKFQNWIVWDALSFPVRFIMPSHYTILCFTKGEPRELPGLVKKAGRIGILDALKISKSLEPLAEGFCLRSHCLANREALRINDRGFLTDIWWDIHRLKHNTRRVDHPCQVPPHLMYRMISIFTKPDEVVLDCFNGAGTTTLAAYQLGRNYIGIELSETYCILAKERHEEILRGLNPFRKEIRTLTAKNSPVPRLTKKKYAVPKKVLQLDIKRIAQALGRLPTRDDVITHSPYSINYYDEYFSSWGEVCAAARTTGMSENRVEKTEKYTQFDLFEAKKATNK